MTEPATKDNVEPMVRRGALKSVAKGLADTAPPAALMVPAIEPLSEYRADAHRRKMDAQGEIDLINERERREDAMSTAVLDALADNCDDEIRAAIAKRDRAVAFEAQRRAAERQVAMQMRAQHEKIVVGAESSLVSTDQPVGEPEPLAIAAD